MLFRPRIALMRRWALGATALIFVSLFYYVNRQWWYRSTEILPKFFALSPVLSGLKSSGYAWSNVPQRYPVPARYMTPLLSGTTVNIPSIQHSFGVEYPDVREAREYRLAAVAKSFQHSWDGYKGYAWMMDEVAPIDGTYSNQFGGWAATLVDTLDTLWIMGLHYEFEAGVNAVAQINFTTSTEQTLNVFETTIRYLGGFLGAYDISGGQYPVLLQKAVEVGEMLYLAFDTPNRMPVTRWDWNRYVQSKL
jgi:mannosyl-oligosaccharide alpha-1,2-mannosidase